MQFNKFFNLIAILVIFTACSTIKKQPKAVPTQQVEAPITKITESGLQYTILVEGKGRKPEAGDKISVHYTGKLLNDTIFDSSLSRGIPFEFILGRGQVIPGWDEGIGYLNVGSKALFVIPSHLAYGDKEMGLIPSNSTLKFEVELLNIFEGPKPYDITGKKLLTTPSGLKYAIVEKGKGIKAMAGMLVSVHYTAFFEDGKKFDSSIERGSPFQFKIGKGMVITGFDEGVSLLSVGDKAKLMIPHEIAYGENGRPPMIPGKTNLIFDVELLEAKIIEQPTPFDVTGKDTLKTASGLKYIMIKMSNGIQAASGKTVHVHYTGYFLDGKVFDSSVERGEPLSFTLGTGQVIPGWDEGISLMKVGEKARIIIPPFLGYGDTERGPIPGGSTLVFDVELIGVQ